jgi:DNA repair ATPase RecN
MVGLHHPPKHHGFVTLPLKSSFELDSIILEVNRMLPQLAGFIEQFNNIVSQHGVNVVTDAQGNMSMDVPASMSETTYNNISNRLGIVDRLINNHGSSINDLFQKGLTIEQKIKQTDHNYTSQLSDQIEKFNILNASYKH